MNGFDYNHIGERLVAKSQGLPVVKIHDHQDLGSGITKVICSLTFDAGQQKNLEAVKNFFGGKVSPIEASFRRINDATETRLVSVGFMAANRTTEELTEERAKTMTIIARNCMMDMTDKSLWNVKESAAGAKYISRQQDEDLSELMHKASTRKIGVPSLATVASCDPCVSSYVAVIDPEVREVRHGYVMATQDGASMVMCRETGEALKVSDDLIVSAYENVDTADRFLERQLNRVEKSKVVVAKLDDAQALKDYYKAVYQYAPQYLLDVDKIIDQQASL